MDLAHENCLKWIVMWLNVLEPLFRWPQKCGQWVLSLAQTFFLLLSLQGRPPTKKATVLNKVNKVLPSLTGTDGEGTEHTCTLRKMSVAHKHCTESYLSSLIPPFFVFCSICVRFWVGSVLGEGNLSGCVGFLLQTCESCLTNTVRNTLTQIYYMFCVFFFLSDVVIRASPVYVEVYTQSL